LASQDLCQSFHNTTCCLAQDLNPIPFAVTFASSSTWIAYGFLGRDYFMFPQNIVGFVAAVFNSLVCYGTAPQKVSPGRSKSSCFSLDASLREQGRRGLEQPMHMVSK
jgi:hypothetical protein